MNQLTAKQVQYILHKGLRALRDIPVDQRPQQIGMCHTLGEIWRVGGWLNPEDNYQTEIWLALEGLQQLDHALGLLFKRWPDGTKCPGYPVPSCQEGVWEGDAYYRACESRAIWKGEYGKRRIALLDWLIEETKT